MKRALRAEGSVRTLLHISDVHFGPKFVPEALEQVERLMAARKPSLVVISGDLTQRAKPVQFEQARRFVDSLEVPSVVVPGNHDVPMYRFWERFFAPYGAYRKYFAEELEPTFEDEDFFVVGVNTAYNWTTKHGRVTRSRLARLDQQLARAPEGKMRLVVLHHELAPAPRFGSRKVLRNARRLVDVLVQRRVELVLSGHLHQAFVADTEQFYPSGQQGVPIIVSGTSTSSRGRGAEHGRNTLNWIEIEPGALRVERLTWKPGAVGFERENLIEIPRWRPAKSGSNKAAHGTA